MNYPCADLLLQDPVDPICAEVFKDNGHKLVEKKLSREELLATIGQYDGLVVRSGVKVTEEVCSFASAEGSSSPLSAKSGALSSAAFQTFLPARPVQIIKHGSKLKVIGRAGAGVDNIDTVAATRRGITVMNTPGGNTSAAAELTMSLLMTMARQIPAAVESLKVRRSVAGVRVSHSLSAAFTWGLRSVRRLPVESCSVAHTHFVRALSSSPGLQGGVWDRKTFSKGVELKGKTVGVVGLGMIGTEVARRCQALDMTTIGFDPLMTEEKAAAAGACRRARAFGVSGVQSAVGVLGGPGLQLALWLHARSRNGCNGGERVRLKPAAR